ncbi:MAG: hypothetical protein GY777_23525 [Candidatus Brocadiaceae bacterium]|nr:hypothetical protein [Candidatus Brocadiaceae bacterium]
MATHTKPTDATSPDRYDDLISKINDINRRIDDLEKTINLAVLDLKTEARKTSFLRKLLWLD